MGFRDAWHALSAGSPLPGCSPHPPLPLPVPTLLVSRGTWPAGSMDQQPVLAASPNLLRVLPTADGSPNC